MPPLTRRISDESGDRTVFGGRYYSRIFSSSFLFSAAINLLMLGLPLYSLQVFTRAIPSGNVDTLVMLTVIVVLVLSITGLLEVVRARLLNRASNALEVAWRARLSQEVLEQAARGRPDPAPLADLAEVKGFLNRPTFTALADLPWTPLYVIGIYLIHPLLAMVMVVAALILVAVGVGGHFAMQSLAERMKTPAGRGSRLMEATLARAETVRAMRMGPALLDTAARETLTASAWSSRLNERGAAVAALSRWVRYLLQVACTGVGAWLVIDNHLSFGGMIATSMLVGRAMAPIEQTAGGWTGTLKSIQAWQRLFPLLRKLDREPRRVGVPVEADRLTVENVLYVNPRDQKPILRSVSFTVEAGEVVVIAGANRSGKSVLARLLAGAWLPTAGTLRLGGLAVASLTPDDPARAIGYLPQQPDFLPGTIAENIARFLPHERQDVVEAARMAGVHGWIETLPNGYDTEATDPLFPLTGAAARLVGLARAAFGNPALVVLDEPTAGLDPDAAQAVRGFMAAAKERGITTVVLTCDTSLAEGADRTLVLNNGMTVAVQPRPQPVKAEPPAAVSWGRVNRLGPPPAIAATP